MTLTLSPDELRELREDAEATLPSVCNLVTLDRSRDNRGQVLEDISVTSPDFPCAVEPLDALPEDLTTLRSGLMSGWRITMPLSVVPSDTDYIGFDVEGQARLGSIVTSDDPQSEASLRSLIVREP